MAHMFNQSFADSFRRAADLLKTCRHHSREGPGPIVLVASAHKVGSTWLQDLLRDCSGFSSLPMPRLFLETGTVRLDRRSFWRYTGFFDCPQIYKSHSFPPQPGVTGATGHRAHFVTLIRDPRDVLVSAAHYLAKLPKEQGGKTDFLQRDLNQRIQALLQGEGDFLHRRLQAWGTWNSDRLCRLRYEELRRSTENELGKALSFIDLPVDSGLIRSIIEDNSLERKKRQQSVTDYGLRRKGMPGTWKEVFDARSIRSFKQAGQGKWERLLHVLGYGW